MSTLSDTSVSEVLGAESASIHAKQSHTPDENLLPSSVKAVWGKGPVRPRSVWCLRQCGSLHWLLPCALPLHLP